MLKLLRDETRMAEIGWIGKESRLAKNGSIRFSDTAFKDPNFPFTLPFPFPFP